MAFAVLVLASLRLEGGLQLLDVVGELRYLAGSCRRRLGRALFEEFDALVHPGRLQSVRFCFFIQNPDAVFKSRLLLNEFGLLPLRE